MPSNSEFYRFADSAVVYPNQYCPHQPYPKQLAFLMLKPPIWPVDGIPLAKRDDNEYAGGAFGRAVPPNAD